MLYNFELENLLIGIVNRISLSKLQNVRETAKGINFRCNVCRDSKNNKRKRRGWVLTGTFPYVYYCHNCGYSTSVLKWMEEYFPEYYDEYITTKRRMWFESKLKENNDELEKDSLENLKFNKIKSTVDISYYAENFNEVLKNDTEIKKSQSILKSPKAMEWCEQRGIPKKFYKKWGFCKSGFYKDRVVIPFLDDRNKIYYFIARSIHKNVTLKYLNPESNVKPFYNIYNVDIDIPVIFMEGVIDSLFVNNSVAMIGAKINNFEKLKIDKNKIYFLFDNDKTGKKNASEKMDEGYNVFLWKKFIHDNDLSPAKDINELMKVNNIDNMENYNYMDYFSNNLIYRYLL